MISALTRHVKKTASRYVRSWLRKMVRIMTGPWRDVMLSRCFSRLDWWKYYSLYGGMWNLFCRVRHYPCIQTLLWRIRRRNPPCNAEDNTARQTHRHWSLVQGLLRESWIRGCSGSRTIPSAGLLDYEDTRLKTSSRVRMGLYLAWKAS